MKLIWSNCVLPMKGGACWLPVLFVIWNSGGRVGLFNLCAELMHPEDASLPHLKYEKQWGECAGQDCPF